jgi:hypothetical protein
MFWKALLIFAKKVLIVWNIVYIVIRNIINNVLTQNILYCLYIQLKTTHANYNICARFLKNMKPIYNLM